MYKHIQDKSCVRFLLPSLAAVIVTGMLGMQTKAAKAPDGTVAFESAVLLVDAHTTFNAVRMRQARYYFDLELPEDVGEPLQRVVIKQRTGGDDIKFRLDETEAYLGNHRDKEDSLEVTTSQDETTGAITVEFEQPVAAGNSLTVGLKPKRNPDYAGTYLFGVTAYPVGEKSLGMYLGPGRLKFYRNGDFYL